MIRVNINNTFFLLLLFAAITSSQINTSFNLLAIFFALIVCLFNREFFSQIIKWFVEKKTIIKFLCVYLLIHPFIILLMVNIDPDFRDISLRKIFLSSTGIILQISILIFIYQRFSERNYNFIFKVFLAITLFHFFEWLLFYFNIINLGGVTKNYQLIGMLFKSNVYVSIIGLLSFYYLFSEFYKSRKYIYIILLIINYMVLIFSFQRASLMCIALFIILFFSLKNVLKLKNLIYLIGFVLIAFLIFKYIGGIRTNFYSLTSMYERLFFWINGLDIFIDNFIFGVGGENIQSFYRINNGYLMNIFIEYVETNSIPDLLKRLVIFRSYTDTSSHNTYIDIIANYGLIGIVILLMLYFKCLKLLIFSIRDKNNLNLDLFTANLFFLTLTVLMFTLSITQYSWLVFLPFIYTVRIDKNRKKYNYTNE